MFLAVKVVHLLSLIAWMAGLFYLPRLYVYHRDVPAGEATSELFKVMERRLDRAIMRPAAVVTWASGLWLSYLGGHFAYIEGWWIAKISLVVAMSVFHFWLAQMRVVFAADGRPLTSRWFRAANEIPTVILIAIVVLVVVRPF